MGLLGVKTDMDNYKKSDKYLAEGCLWRAKEILQGHLATSKYDVVLFEKYGLVLLEMGDLLEAGKYLFLSGIRKPEYRESISIYLGRYEKKNINLLFHTFPHAAQTSEFTTYPESVVYELTEKGYKAHKVKEVVDKRNEVKETVSSKIFSGFTLLVILGILGGLVIQGFRGLYWSWQWLAS